MDHISWFKDEKGLLKSSLFLYNHWVLKKPHMFAAKAVFLELDNSGPRIYADFTADPQFSICNICGKK